MLPATNPVRLGKVRRVSLFIPITAKDTQYYNSYPSFAIQPISAKDTTFYTYYCHSHFKTFALISFPTP
jgi:hypothetical protein